METCIVNLLHLATHLVLVTVLQGKSEAPPKCLQWHQKVSHWPALSQLGRVWLQLVENRQHPNTEHACNPNNW
jgi:hypothetical protein